MALDGVKAELNGVRTLCERLVREVGQPDQIRSERAALEHAVARVRSEREDLLDELVARELAAEPRWAREALADRPTGSRERDLWDRAVRGLARYDQARSTLARVQRQLGDVGREHKTLEPTSLPRYYLGLLGEERSGRLETELAAELERVRDLPDEQLRALAREEQQARDRLDHQAAGQALRFEREHTHHQDAARKQTQRAAALEQQALGLGWRARHEREQIRHNATLQRDHAARHSADAERLDLELSRLRAAGRHPDQWLEHDGERLVAGVAAASELARRHQREISWHAELAVIQPPAHVRELIGERPASGVRLAQEWEQLASDIERHRHARGLPAHEQALELTREHGRDQALGLELYHSLLWPPSPPSSLSTASTRRCTGASSTQARSTSSASS